MIISNEVREYIERALRNKIKDQCPNYGDNTIDDVVHASMDGAYLNVNSETLYMAIDLAIRETSQIKHERDEIEGNGEFVTAMLDKIFTGGNHLANVLLELGIHVPYSTDNEVARLELADFDNPQMCYDAWICWAEMMRARDALRM